MYGRSYWAIVLYMIEPMHRAMLELPQYASDQNQNVALVGLAVVGNLGEARYSCSFNLLYISTYCNDLIR